MRRLFVASCAFLTVAIVGVACSRGYDLGIGTGGGGAGGSGTHATTTHATTSATSSSSGRGTGGTTGTGGGEPAGPSALTVVNGLNDYPAVLFCFLPNETPWPSAAGLAYGAAQVVDLATALPMGADVQTWIVAGDLAATAGMTCSQIRAAAQQGGGGSDAGADASTDASTDASSEAGADAAADATGGGGGGTGGAGTGGAGGSDAGTDAAPDAPIDAAPPDAAGAGDAGADAADDGGPGADAGADGGGGPPFLVAQLGTIPASILTAGRSLLLVPTGCLGGAGHQNPNAPAGCGASYTGASPTVGVVLVAMSRILDPQNLSLQYVNASAALPASDMRILPSVTNPLSVLVAPDLAEGVIGPSPPYHAHDVATLGPLGTVQLQTVSPGGVQPSSVVMLSTVLASSAFKASDVVNGASFVFVAIGGAPGAQAGPFWHSFGYAMIRANP